MSERESRICGCLLGGAVGDALGLPYENLTPRRAARLLGEPTRFRMLFGRGLCSDDTEHAVLTAEALIASAFEPQRFERELAARMRLWFLTLPAGLGLATLKACTRLCIGIPPARSGVNSAGNGPAMRAPLLGAAVDDPVLLRRLVTCSTRITHTDARAEQGAAAAAFAAHVAARDTAAPGEFSARFAAWMAGADEELLRLLDKAAASALRREPTEAFAKELGLAAGVSGFIYHSVPVALHAWLLHQSDYAAAVEAVIRCGGDTDTMAAVTGAIVGARLGEEGIPRELLGGLWNWPLTPRYLSALGRDLARACEAGGSVGAYSQGRRSGRRHLASLLRNLGFAAVVVLHGLRRLLPPY